MSEEKQFVNGMIVDKFDFQNGGRVIKLGIKVDELVEFLYEHINEKGWVNIDVQESKGGKMYAALNTFQKTLEDSK